MTDEIKVGDLVTGCSTMASAAWNQDLIGVVVGLTTTYDAWRVTPKTTYWARVRWLSLSDDDLFRGHTREPCHRLMKVSHGK